MSWRFGPVFRNAGRTRGHVLVVMLALILERDPKTAGRHCHGVTARFGRLVPVTLSRSPLASSGSRVLATKPSAAGNPRCPRHTTTHSVRGAQKKGQTKKDIIS